MRQQRRDRRLIQVRCNIVYDNFNRLRVRCGSYVLTQKQSFGLANELKKLAYVENAEVNHVSGSILVDYQSGRREDVLKYIKSLVIRDIPEGEVPSTVKADEKFRSDLTVMVGKKLAMNIIPTPIRTVITIFKAAKYVIKGLDSLLKADINVAVLDGTSVGVSVALGSFKTASSIMFLLGLSELLEDYTRNRTKLALSEQLSLNIDNVWLKTDGEPVQVPYSEIREGDKVIVYAGNVIPFDGAVVENEAMVNQATMTGESEPVCKKAGDSVFAGTAVEAGSIVVEVRSLADNSRLQKIIDLIDESENLKAGVQSRAEKLADSIVPYSFLGFAAAWLLTGNLTKAVSVLMVDFSCAIKLSTPISVISAMREAAEYGATVKGGKYLEAFAAADTIVFDKTGTLTNANPKVIDVVSFNGYERDYVLKTAACLEEHFPHSVATAVVNKASEENLLHDEEHAEVEYLVAHGIVTKLNGERAIIGSAHFVFEDEGIELSEEQTAEIKEKSCGNSSIFLAIGSKLAGMIVIDDPVRDDAAEIISMLRRKGINRICMLTGDAEAAAARVAKQLGLDMYVSQVLPEHKSEYIKALQANGHKVIMVGDGVNDTPALAAANVSAAMSDGSDIAREVADITLCNDDLTGLVAVREISTRLMERIHGNYRFIVGFNAALIILGIAGVITPAASALLHNGSTMLISAKSMTKLCRENDK